MPAFDLSKCARPNILQLEPYRCARDEYKDDGSNILLDANENAYGPALSMTGDGKLVNGDGEKGGDGLDIDVLGLNRYPDPHQRELKQLFCNLRNTHVHTSQNLSPDNLFTGVGSDEVIDALFRCFCTPGQDKILTCPPTYGMYAVSAHINDVGVVKVPLLPSENFELDTKSICDQLSSDPRIKLVYICSPGNPTAALVPKAKIQPILEHPTWNGVVVIDEAYVDFSPPDSSIAEWVLEWPNLVVMQTLSKAYGLAGIRLGAGFTSAPIARLLNSLKAPYNISNPTSQLARAALGPKHSTAMHEKREKIVEQRSRMLNEMPKIPGVGKFLGGSDANYLLVQMLDKPADQDGKPSNETALGVYETLAEKKGVVVRFRGKEYGCEGCLRVTVGTEKEVDRFLRELENVLRSLHGNSNSMTATEEQTKEKEANGVIS